ncbi:MAG TPA: patatin-like phospholipase family protein [Anaerolineae bacterium]|nr:patatin-like phospholipase family protein [Anaerolineae bacterium]
MTTRRIGLVLSGGGALGAAHVGVLEVLEEAGIRPGCVAGTSAGSAVGAAYCGGVSLSKIREVASNLQWSQLGRVVRPRGGFFDGTRLEEYLIDLIGDRSFEDLDIPFAAAAADILGDELLILNSGPVASAVRASCAFPGVFTPVEVEGRLLVDGGLINNLPVSAARDLGAEYIIAVDLSAPLVGRRKPPSNLMEMWFMSLATLIRNTNREAAMADVVIQPEVGEYNWVELNHAQDLMERGRKAATLALPQILADLKVEG